MMRKAVRTKAAIFLAAFYAFVMLAPHAALALDAAKILHCLDDAAAASSHGHDEAAGGDHPHAQHGSAQHEHAGKANDDGSPNPPIACCGLFSITAIPSNAYLDFGVAPRAVALMPAFAERSNGEGPGNITKPPRA